MALFGGHSVTPAVGRRVRGRAVPPAPPSPSTDWPLLDDDGQGLIVHRAKVRPFPSTDRGSPSVEPLDSMLDGEDFLPKLGAGRRRRPRRADRLRHAQESSKRRC